MAERCSLCEQAKQLTKSTAVDVDGDWDFRVEVDEHALLETVTSSAATIRVPADLCIAPRSADANNKLHHNMLSVKELADRVWAGKDVEMIAIAASSAYRNDSLRDLDPSVQRLLGKWGNRFLMESPSLTLCARWASLLMQQMRRQMLREATTSEKLPN